MGAIVGGDNQRLLGRLRILFRDRRNASFRTCYLMHSALQFGPLYGLSNLFTDELLDHLLQLQIFLASDLLEPHCPHAGVLQLREWPPCLDRFVLPGVADQEHPVVRMEPPHETMHLLGRGKRALVEQIESLVSGIGLLTRARWACKVELKAPIFAVRTRFE